MNDQPKKSTLSQEQTEALDGLLHLTFNEMERILRSKIMDGMPYDRVQDIICRPPMYAAALIFLTLAKVMDEEAPMDEFMTIALNMFEQAQQRHDAASATKTNPAG